ncbi:hypothetical protein [Streptomyces sp. GbtcB6]|nr:hypothetical protein [Streptomyces sp. GbtcB6]
MGGAPGQVGVGFKDNRRGPAGNRFAARVGEGVSAEEVSGT